MRPIPAKHHHWAVLVFLAIVAANTLLNLGPDPLSDDQANLLSEALKRGDGSLFAGDEVFGPTGERAPYNLHTPAWTAICLATLRGGTSADPLLGLRALNAVMLLLYLLCMYILLYRQTHSTWPAVLVSIMSAAIFSIKTPFWGMGPLQVLGPATLYMAMTPLLVAGFLRLRHRPAVLWVFLAAGMWGNFCLSSCFNLVAVMLVAMVALDRGRRMVLLMGTAGIALAVVGCLPSLYHHWLVHAALPGSGNADTEVLRRALDEAGLDLLYPGLLLVVLRWAPLPALLALPSAIILSRSGRHRAYDLAGWLWFAAAALVVGLVMQGFIQLLAQITGTMPISLRMSEALRLAVLPLYVLLAQSIIQLLRLTVIHRGWIKAGLILVGLIYLGTSYNTLPLRHLARQWVVQVSGQEADQPGDADDQELQAIATWAGANTPRDAVFLTSAPKFRLLARRSLMCSPSDVMYICRLAPLELDHWTDMVRQQRSLLRPEQGGSANGARIAAFIIQNWRAVETAPPPEPDIVDIPSQPSSQPSPAAAPAGGIPPTYVLLADRDAPAQDPHLRPVQPPEKLWGRYWRLFELVLWPPASAPATEPAEE